MIRKSLFWGLTLVLAAALVTLIVRGRKLEKQQAGKVVEVIQESKSSPMRVLSPTDLEMIQPRMLLEKAASGTSPGYTARHEMEIRNKGTVPYNKIRLSFVYVDRGGKSMATRYHDIEQILSPGNILRLTDIKIEGLPAAIVDCRTSVVYAELASGPK